MIMTLGGGHFSISNWVIRVMESSRDMVSTLLCEQYGHALNWSVWENPLRGDSPFVAGLRGIFLIIRPFCKPQLGDGALFWFWEYDWSGHGQLGAVSPRLYALAPITAATVRSMWTGAWTPTLPQALLDQRLADFMSLQVRLANLRQTEEIIDAWKWRHYSFSARTVYRLLRGQEPSEATALVRLCRVIWKQRLPLMIRIFGWLLVRCRLMTRAMRHRLVLGAIMNCPLCDGEIEDCSHLFFTCPMVQEAWRTSGAARPTVSSDVEFWSSFIDNSFRREKAWRRVFATL